MNKQEIEKAISIIRASSIEGDALFTESIDVILNYAEHQLTNGWIPVSERLPEESSQRVLVTLKNGMVLEAWYINNDFKYHESPSRGGLEKLSEFNPVIAWQPLPESWKGDIQ